MLDETLVGVFDPADNVATAKTDLAAGTDIGLVNDEGEPVLLRDQILFGHKVATHPIPENGWVVKYGARVGQATQAIEAGEHVHIHNVVSLRGTV
jgi:altronate dehydratase small subunit